MALHRPSDQENGHERGVAVLINKLIHHEEIPLNTNLQAIAVKLYLDKTYTICNIYIPHQPPSKPEIQNLLNQLPEPFIFLGDMNAHSPMWGARHENDKGKAIAEIIEENDVVILNSETPTHFHIQTGSYSLIDLAVSSASCSQDFTHTVLPSLHDSDHYPICIQLVNSAISFDKPTRYNTKKADWNKYKALTEMQPLAAEGTTCDSWLDEIVTMITTAADEAIPKTSGKRVKPSTPWWNPECTKAKKERKRAERALERVNTEFNRIWYKRSCAKCRYTFNEARKSSWQEYVSSLTPNVRPNQVWKRLSKMRGKYAQSPLPTLLRDGELVVDPQQTANILAETFASNDRNYSDQFIRHKNRVEQRPIYFHSAHEHPYNATFSKEEFTICLSKTSESAPGPDNITYPMLKSAHPTLLDNLLRLYNRLFEEETFPSMWHHSIIIPIPKPYKNPQDPEFVLNKSLAFLF